jgi:hypothetical protein
MAKIAFFAFLGAGEIARKSSGNKKVSNEFCILASVER